jgi:hypothetical protein
MTICAPLNLDGRGSVALGSRRAGPFRARRDPARLFDDAFVDVMEIAEDIDQALNIVGHVLGV